MALKRQFDMSATFSMASMTDVIFLLLIFFMVTSTFVFPNALEVNLPQSASQTSLKPSAQIFIDADGNIATTYGGQNDLQQYESVDGLKAFLALVAQQEEKPFVALYADETVPYGRVVEILNLGAQFNVKVVLATTAPTPSADGNE